MSKTNLPPFYAVTVSYSSGGYLPDLIASLAPLPFLKKLLVINHAPEEDLSGLSAPFPLEVIVQENAGYGAGLNRGLREIMEPDALVLLCNPDIILSTPDGVPEALAYLTAHPEVGCLIPKSVNFEGEFLFPCRTFYSFKTLLAARIGIFRRAFAAAYRRHLYLDTPADQMLEVDWGYAAAVFYRASALNPEPAFDPRFFLYMEDVDFCLRLWQAGLKVLYYPEVLFTHHSQRDSRRRWRFLIYHLTSFWKYFLKYRGLPQRLDLVPGGQLSPKNSR